MLNVELLRRCRNGEFLNVEFLNFEFSRFEFSRFEFFRFEFFRFEKREAIKEARVLI